MGMAMLKWHRENTTKRLSVIQTHSTGIHDTVQYTHDSNIPTIIGSDGGPEPRMFKALMVILMTSDGGQWDGGMFITYSQMLSGQEATTREISE